MVSQHTIAGHNGIPTTEYTEMTGRNLHSENIKNGEPFTQWGKYAINMQAISCHVNRPLCLHIAKTRSMEILTSLCYNCKVCWCYIWLCVRVYAYSLVYFWKPKFSDREYLPDAWWTCPIFSDMVLINLPTFLVTLSGRFFPSKLKSRIQKTNGLVIFIHYLSNLNFCV